MGQFSQLHTLVINLGYYHWSIDRRNAGPSFLREALINAAIDEDLARGIWNVIVSKQSAQNLRRLGLVPFGAGAYEGDEMDAIQQVSRSFPVTPNACTGKPQDIREIGTEVQNFQGLPRNEIEGSHYRSTCLKEVLKKLVASGWGGDLENKELPFANGPSHCSQSYGVASYLVVSPIEYYSFFPRIQVAAVHDLRKDTACMFHQALDLPRWTGVVYAHQTILGPRY
ncbi:hypothetical protein BDV40DRAFT_263719 [Aspergillus tamarii]|uniref:Uncharacterized protein n=1 Tax=Aspergillus tamarii TaxID=41984 RepID=A0A5N6UZ70_ASPTM|nr:hypothetical protein BDV40DRAFT_263719 [Aspergillus tamarii]